MKLLTIISMMISFSAFASFSDYKCEANYWKFANGGRIERGGIASFNLDNSMRFQVNETGVATTLTGRIEGDQNFVVLTMYHNNIKVAESMVPENQDVTQEFKIMVPGNLQLGWVKVHCGTNIYDISRAPAVVDDSGREEQNKDVSITHHWRSRGNSVSDQ